MMNRLLVVALVGMASVASAKGPDKKKAPAPAPVVEQPIEAPPAEDTLPEGNTRGPRLIDLGHGTELNLPEGFIYLDVPHTTKVMSDIGEDVEGVAGAVFAETTDWHLVLFYEDQGHVTDGDSLEPDALLESFKQGTIEQNKERAKHDVTPLYIDDWMQKPQYDRVGHQLSWGIFAHDDKDKIVNYTTTFLGRTGLLRANLIDAPETLAAAREMVKPVLANLHFKPGQRYDDYRAGDHSSGLGLGAIVLGGAGVAVASKTGLFIGLLVALKKGVVFLVVGAAALFRKIFGIKKKTSADV